VFGDCADITMLDITDIKNLDSESILITYEGKNPYIKYMRKKLETEKNYFLTNSQSNYVKNYFTFEPKNINRVTEVTNYFAEQLKEEHKLKTRLLQVSHQLLSKGQQHLFQYTKHNQSKQ